MSVENLHLKYSNLQICFAEGLHVCNKSKEVWQMILQILNFFSSLWVVVF